MRSLALAVLVLSSTTPQLHADSPQKPYFAATQPGTWAKYESSWEMPDGMAGTNIYTYIRASDSADRVRIEFDTETLAGPGAGMITRQLFIMEPGFDMAGNFLNHGKFTEASIAQTGDGPPSLMQPNVLTIIREVAGDLTNSVTFKGRAEKVGRDCDLYAYSYRSGGPRVSFQEGEICLDETVPFGVVYQKGRVTDAEGELTSSFEQKLLESGADASGAAALLAMTPEAVPATSEGAAPEVLPAITLLEAYQSEKIRLVFEVLEGSGGRRLDLVVVNKAEEPIDLVVPQGPMTIPADSPLGVLNLYVGEEQRISIAPGGSSPALSVGQTGRAGRHRREISIDRVRRPAPVPGFGDCGADELTGGVCGAAVSAASPAIVVQPSRLQLACEQRSKNEKRRHGGAVTRTCPLRSLSFVLRSSFFVLRSSFFVLRSALQAGGLRYKSPTQILRLAPVVPTFARSG